MVGSDFPWRHKGDCRAWSSWKESLGYPECKPEKKDLSLKYTVTEVAFFTNHLLFMYS